MEGSGLTPACGTILAFAWRGNPHKELSQAVPAQI
jgi:hypothetical protein